MTDEIDVRLMTKGEAAEYHRLRRRLQGTEWRVGLMAGLAVLAWLGAWGGLLMLSLTFWKSDPSGFGDDFVGFLALVAMVGGWFPLYTAVKSYRASLEDPDQVDDYLYRIGYQDRLPKRATAETGGETEWKSRRQMQHEWYEGHSELDWRDRQR
uniref:hypothetical protein n=1 Tax=Agromyces humi TaxID=1766800 RepID=UPI0013588605